MPTSQASIAELRRCVEELGFVGCNLNPDPSGGYWTSPPLTDRSWYPFYEAMVELDVPAMVHVSASANPVFHATGAYYINADTTAFMQLVQGDLFARPAGPATGHPARRGSGALPLGPLPGAGRHARAAAGGVQRHGQRLLRHLRLPPARASTCCCDVVDTPNILFGSEMVGAVRGIDPRTGHHYDDTRRYVEAARRLDADDARDRGLRGQRPPRLPPARRGAGGRWALTAGRGQIVSGTRRCAIATSNSAVSTTSMPMAGANSSRNSRAPSLACSRCAPLS